MRCDLERLQDLIDGELSSASRAETERHASECLVCRRELAALRALAAEARSLSGEIEPARDLWPGIAAGLDRAGVRRPLADPHRYRDRAPRRLYWAAAALAALALAWPLAARWASRAQPAPVAEAARAPAASAALLAAADQARSEDGVMRTHRDLLEALEVRRGELAPETLATLEENLRLIDEAIGEIRSALAKDPGNRSLSLLLAIQYRQEASVLRQLNRT